MQQWNKGLRHKMAVMSEEGAHNQQELQEDCRVGGCEASSWDFHRVMGSEWLDTVEGSGPSEMKEEMSKPQPLKKNKDGGGTPRLAYTSSGNHSGWVALRREQQKQLKSNHHKNWATGKEGKTNHRHHKHSPQNGSMPVGTALGKQEIMLHLYAIQDE
jgi:hypothetical protein